MDLSFLDFFASPDSIFFVTAGVQVMRIQKKRRKVFLKVITSTFIDPSVSSSSFRLKFSYLTNITKPEMKTIDLEKLLYQ